MVASLAWLRQKRVHAVGQDGHFGGDLVASRAHARHVPVFPHQTVNGNAEDAFRPRLFGLRRQPAVEGPAQHGIRGVLRAPQAGRGELHRRVLVFGDEGYALRGDLAFQRRLFGEVGEHGFQRVRVDAPARHVLGAGVGPALYQKHAFAGAGQLVRCNRSGASGPHHHRIKVCHGRPFL